MSKRIYKSTKLQDVKLENVTAAVRGRRVVVGVDVAKFSFYAVVSTGRRSFEVTVRWEAPEETDAFVAFVVGLRGAATEVVVAMEPTGTYGDALRARLESAGVAVYRVSPKRVHDAAEDFDGVPSSHDAKSAAIVAQQHWDDKSHRWLPRAESERRLRALVEMAGECHAATMPMLNRLESKLARFFPELTQQMALGSTSLLTLLSEYPSPARVASAPTKVTELLLRAGRNMVSREKAETVLEAARTSTGEPMIAEEAELIMSLCKDVLRLRALQRTYDKRIEDLAKDRTDIAELGPVVGVRTAATIITTLGSPTDYAHPAAFVKALGLNLKVHSSGEYRGQLHITKRGPGRLRALLFLAVLRLLKSNPIIGAWYQKKVERDGEKRKYKAIIAIMRKLAGALWHVARGSAFDASKLFDTRRLQLEPLPATDVGESDGELDGELLASLAA